MKTANDVKNSTIGSYALTVCQSVLNNMYSSPTYNRSDHVLVYLLIHHYISKSQCLKLCCLKSDQWNTLSVSIRRIENKQLIKKINYDTSSGKETILTLTKAGVDEAKKIYADELHKLLSQNEYLRGMRDFICQGTSVSETECADFLAERCVNARFSKKQLSHSLGVKETYFAFLSSAGYKSPYPFSYDQEVTFDSDGKPFDFYTKLYRGQNFPSGPVRSDSALSFYYGAVDREPLNVYVEYDTGSQSSQVLTEKIEQYCGYVFDNLIEEKCSSLPFLVFSLESRVKRSEMKPTDKVVFNPRERYLAQGLSLAAAIYLSFYPDMYGVTLYELREFLESVPMSERDCGSFIPLLDLCIAELGGEKNAIDVTDKLYDSYKNASVDDEYYVHQCDKYYKNRRGLLHQSIDTVPNMKARFLRGMSICSVSTMSPAAIRTLIPECCSLSARLRKDMVAPLPVEDVGASRPVKVASLRSLSPFLLPGGEEIWLRNVYGLSDGRKIAVENIGDDYGGYVRVKHLLETGTVPCDILCLFAPYDIERVKELFSSYRGSSILDRFYAMSYICKEEERKDEKTERIFTYDEVVLPGMLSMREFLG